MKTKFVIITASTSNQGSNFSIRAKCHNLAGIIPEQLYLKINCMKRSFLLSLACILAAFNSFPQGAIYGIGWDPQSNSEYFVTVNDSNCLMSKKVTIPGVRSVNYSTAIDTKRNRYDFFVRQSKQEFL